MATKEEERPTGALRLGEKESRQSDRSMTSAPGDWPYSVLLDMSVVQCPASDHWDADKRVQQSGASQSQHLIRPGSLSRAS